MPAHRARSGGARWPRPPPWPRSGETRAARWRGSTTPVTPAHSALRSSEPRLCGSVTPSQTSRKGAAVAVGREQVVELDRLERPGQGEHALVRLGGGRSIEPGPAHDLDGDPRRAAQRLDAVELLGGVQLGRP